MLLGARCPPKKKAHACYVALCRTSDNPRAWIVLFKRSQLRVQSFRVP